MSVIHCFSLIRDTFRLVFFPGPALKRRQYLRACLLVLVVFKPLEILLTQRLTRAIFLSRNGDEDAALWIAPLVVLYVALWLYPCLGVCLQRLRAVAPGRTLLHAAYLALLFGLNSLFYAWQMPGLFAQMLLLAFLLPWPEKAEV